MRKMRDEERRRDWTRWGIRLMPVIFGRTEIWMARSRSCQLY
jgi:hypothetical protein